MVSEWPFNNYPKQKKCITQKRDKGLYWFKYKLAYGLLEKLDYKLEAQVEMGYWMNPKMELRLLEEISTTSNMHMIPL